MVYYLLAPDAKNLIVDDLPIAAGSVKFGPGDFLDEFFVYFLGDFLI